VSRLPGVSAISSATIRRRAHEPALRCDLST
jgi:hypothetical protein